MREHYHVCQLEWYVAFCGTLLFLGTVGSRPVRAEHSQDLKQRFLEEAPRSWQEYRSFTERFIGKITRIVKKEEETTMHLRWELKRNEDCRLILVQDDLHKKQSRGEVRAFNPLYEFSLVRKSMENSWVVSDYKLRPASESAAGAIKRTGLGWGRTSALISLYDRDLPELLKQPTFQVVRAGWLKRDGIDLVQIEFDNTHEFKPTTTPGEFFPIQSGSLLLDPERSWCLRAFEHTTKYTNGDDISKGEFKWRDTLAQRPIPKQVVVTSEGINPSTKERERFRVVTDYELGEPSPLPPDEEFTLAAFGLPEPFEVQQARSSPRLYLWVGLAGGLCLVLGLVFYRFKQRTR